MTILEALQHGSTQTDLVGLHFGGRRLVRDKQGVFYVTEWKHRKGYIPLYEGDSEDEAVRVLLGE